MDVGEVLWAARPRVVAALAARLRDLDQAEDAFSDACAAALSTWGDEPPSDPAAWLWRVASRKALDARRRAAVRARLAPDPPEPDPSPEEQALAADPAIPDERLRLIFVCCHPALAPDARAVLTLKVVCGLSTARLARAFLTQETTVQQRIVRAKRKIRDAAVPFEVPGPKAWAERLEAVLATLEIAYAQAYEDAALADDGAPFAAEVLRLSGLLTDLVPHEPEVLGLAALVRFAEARRPARIDPAGAMVPLTEQEPALWDRALIAQGALLLGRAADLGRTGPRQLLAAIHGAHLSRRPGAAPPWTQIATLYDALVLLRPDPVTAVNRAVALGEAKGPAAGLAALEAVDGDRLGAWLPYHAARASLLAAAGRSPEAAGCVRRALSLHPAPAERAWLERRLAGLSERPPGGAGSAPKPQGA